MTGGGTAICISLVAIADLIGTTTEEPVVIAHHPSWISATRPSIDDIIGAIGTYVCEGQVNIRVSARWRSTSMGFWVVPPGGQQTALYWLMHEEEPGQHATNPCAVGPHVDSPAGHDTFARKAHPLESASWIECTTMENVTKTIGKWESIIEFRPSGLGLPRAEP